MKNKKLLLPAVIIAVAVLAIAVFSIVSGIANKPTVTEGEFPFSITYELNGEEVTISDVYKARYVRNDGYADTKSRVYVGEIGNMGEDNTIYTLRNDKSGRIELHTDFYADYMMGDAEYSYFDDEEFAPKIYYYDSDEQEYGDKETLDGQGVKLVSFEYPTPIENSFVFSHISYCSGDVVFPTVVISLIALIAIVIFARKDRELQYKKIDVTSLVLDFVVGVTLVPFVSIMGMIIDINGGGPELYRQVLYFIPSFSLLSIALSVALRRKGYAKASLVAVLASPVAFALYLIICGIFGLL